MDALRHSGLATVISGLLAHGIVKRHEPDSVKSMVSLLFFPPVSITFGLHTGFFKTFTIYLLTLALSVITYRLSPFHPLAKYPGPLLARISRLWWFYAALTGKHHLLMQKLHEKYGDIVRTGPNHLSIRNPAAIPVILGAKNRWLKSGWYYLPHPYDVPGSLLLLQPAEHSKRRRLWDRAFTPGSLASYTPSLQSRVSELIHNLSVRSGTDRRVDLAEWLSFMAFDFMGDFAYGGMFTFMKDGKDVTGLKKLIETGTGFAEVLGSIPWFRPIFLSLPTPTHALFDAAGTVGQRRKQQGATVKDLFHYVLGEDGRGDPTGAQMNTATLAQEATLAIVAGSDTTSASLANAVFYLLTHHGAFERLRTEVDSVAKESGDTEALLDTNKLAELPFLHAVINETLRLQPAVPNGVPRDPPPTGGPFVLAGHIIPEGTTVQIPTYVLHRDARYFSPDPEVFWPERWLPEGPKLAESRGESFVHDTSAFAPFSFGPANCVGRSLALLEMRTVLAELIRHFNIKLADGMTDKIWQEELKAKFVLMHGPLWVVLEKRSQTSAA